MKRIWMAILLLVLGISLTGCGRRVMRVTYYSSPPGAEIFINNGTKHIGEAPTTGVYRIDRDDVQRGAMISQGVLAVWPDGRESRVNSLRSEFRDGYNQSYTFQAPAYGSSRGGSSGGSGNSNLYLDYARKKKCNAAKSRYNKALAKYREARAGRQITDYGLARGVHGRKQAPFFDIAADYVLNEAEDNLRNAEREMNSACY